METANTKANTPEITRTSLGMRNALFEEWDSLRSGKSTPQRVSAVARMATAIDNSIKTEIEYQKHVMNIVSSDGGSIPPSSVLQLGE